MQMHLHKSKSIWGWIKEQVSNVEVRVRVEASCLLVVQRQKCRYPLKMRWSFQTNVNNSVHKLDFLSCVDKALLFAIYITEYENYVNEAVFQVQYVFYIEFQLS